MFKPGDVLLYQAPAWKFSNIIPKLIQFITGNKVTHVALYLGCSLDGHLVLDALAGGILIKTMSEFELWSRKDDFTLYGIARLPETHNINPARAFIILEAAKYSRKSYGFLTILNLLLQHGKTRLFPSKAWTTWFKSQDAYICSELCQIVLEDVFVEVKLKSPFMKESNLTEPDDYLSYPWQITLADKN